MPKFGKCRKVKGPSITGNEHNAETPLTTEASTRPLTAEMPKVRQSASQLVLDSRQNAEIRQMPKSEGPLYREEAKRQRNKNKENVSEKVKRTTPGIPTWSPTVVLAWPDDA